MIDLIVWLRVRNVCEWNAIGTRMCTTSSYSRTLHQNLYWDDGNKIKYWKEHNF